MNYQKSGIVLRLKRVDLRHFGVEVVSIYQKVGESCLERLKTACEKGGYPLA